MKRFYMFAAGLFLTVTMAACAVAGTSAEYPSTKIRYKMTVEVETPEGIKTGSSVREISMVSRPEMLAEGNDTHMTLEKGEAVVVDLGERGVLFALLSGPSSGSDHDVWVILRAFPSSCPEGAVSKCSIRYYSNIKTPETKMLDLNNYPTFVKFKDTAEPLSVEIVSKYAERSMPDGYGGEARSIKEVFGSGVSIKSVKIEVTKDIARNGELARVLPWLKNIKGRYLHGGSSTLGAPYGLSSRNFFKE